MTLHIFNPENDLALACPSPHFIPPASARQMADDLSALPVWWAMRGDAVCVASVKEARRWAEEAGGICPEVRWVGRDGLPSDADVDPWGWSPLMVQRLLTGGADRSRLPDEARLARYRELSNRRHAVDMLAYLCDPDLDLGQKWRDRLCGVSYYCTGEQEIIRRMRQYPETLLKAPWSGSGKGLRWCRRGLTKSTADWCRRELVNHGALILEPIYKKEGDFAMEFYSNGRGKVLFSGYSHFITDEKGVYRGNMLVSNEEVEQWILRYIPLEAFVCIRGYLQKVIEGIYGRYYSGPMGIDMMICPDQRGYPYAIYPHVEINVRMTMGMVARQLYDNFVAPGSKGIFNVDNFPSAEALRTQHEQDMRDYPLVVEEGRIVSGYLALVPVTPQSRYRAYVRVEVC